MQSEKTKDLFNLLWDEPITIGHALGYKLLTDIHNKWIAEMIFSNQDHTLQAHRDSYKTTCLIVAITMIMVLYPDIPILLLRKDQDSTVEVVRAVKRNLQSETLQNISRGLLNQPIYFTKDSATELHTNLVPNTGAKESQLMTSGVRSFGLTGKHFKRIFTDDIVTLKDRTSKAERENTKLVYQELQNIRTKDDSVIFNSGTPWHKEDCFSLMPQPERHDCYSTGLLSQKQIAGKRSSMTSSLFAANYELKHIADENALFTNPVYGDYPAVDGLVHVDAAYDGDNTTAITVFCKKDNNIHGYGKVWRKHIQDCYSDIVIIAKNFKGGTIYLENNADKGYAARDLKKMWPAIISYNERMNKHYKISTYLKGEWGNIIWAHETDPEYMSQILDYQEGQDPDDAPDSAASLIQRMGRVVKTPSMGASKLGF